MFGILVLTGLAFAAFLMVAALGALALIFKIAIRLLLLPLLLIKWIVTAVLTLVVGPVLFLVGLLVAAVIGVALFVPLLPFVAVAALVWLIVRANRRPAVV